MPLMTLFLCTLLKKQRELKVTHPSNNFPLLVHANVMLTFFSFYSDVTPERFCLNNKKSWKRKKKKTVKLFKASDG